MRRLPVLLAMLSLAVPTPVVALAQGSQDAPVPRWVRRAPDPPAIESATWILYDDTNGVVLASNEADVSRRMASTTKLMTALLVTERADMDEVVEVPDDYVPVGGQMIGLEHGERWTVRQMLAGLMVKSGNDVADILAVHVAGSARRFVRLMNRRAEQLGLENTRFVNPSGVDAQGHYSSARDLMDLGRAVMAHPELARIMRLKSAVLPGSPVRVVSGTNKLLRSYPGAFGLKTGETPLAGLVLVAGAERRGRRLYAVVMGSADHFKDVTALFDYGFNAFHPPAAAAAPPTTAPAAPQQPAAGTTTTPVAVPPVPEARSGLPTLADAFGWLGRLFGNG
jgi:D-alanyl-D-alanine carboxypeptidase (penicillin-binding protein 5/6)